MSSLVLLGSLSGWGGMSGQPAGQRSTSGPPPPVQADRVLILKTTHTMLLMNNGRTIKTYKIALSRTSGRKERQGDHKTPEGHYVIDQKNAHSHYHLALHISYPGVEDRKRARKDDVDPGGSIMIHGIADQFAWMGALASDQDWTDGCVAVTNPQMDEIWRLVPVGTPVDIQP